MPFRTRTESPRSSLPFSRHIRPVVKDNLANFRFLLQKPHAPLSLLVPIFFVLFFLFLLQRAFYAIFPTVSPASLRLLYQPAVSDATNFLDPCSLATPLPLVHFDPSSRFSAEFAHPVPGDVDPPALTRVFSTFFKAYLFEPTSDIVTNLSSTGRGRPTDVRNALTYSQVALRSFHRDSSIVVRNYSLGYSHLDRVRGSRYVFHLDSASDSVPKRRDVVSVQRTFEGRCYICVKQFDETVWRDPVYMVVPYSERPARLKWFLDQFDRLRATNVQIRLILAVCKEARDDIIAANHLVSSIKFPKDIHISLVPGDRTGFFSRAISIRDGSSAVPKHSIMFITDIDMYIFPPMFDSCRYNSIEGSQVYFPVFYNLYARSSRIDKDAGYWRDSSYGMSCMYKSDFDEIGAYDDAENMFVGWGGEDVALSEAFLKDSRYEVFRAVEPSLRHKWHIKRCEPFTPSYHDCISVTFQQLGTLKIVGRYLLEKKIDAQALYAEGTDEDDVNTPSFDTDESLSDLPRTKIENEKLARRKSFLLRNEELREERLRHMHSLSKRDRGERMKQDHG